MVGWPANRIRPLHPYLRPKRVRKRFRASWLSPTSRFAYRVDGLIMPRARYKAALTDSTHALFNRRYPKAMQQADYVMAVTISRIPRDNPFGATPVDEIAPVESTLDIPMTHDQFKRLLTALEQGPWASAARYEETLPSAPAVVLSDTMALKTLSVYREIAYTNAAGARVMLSSTTPDMDNAQWNRFTQNRHSVSNSPALTTVLDELFSPLESRYRDLEPILDSKLPKPPIDAMDPDAPATAASNPARSAS